MCVEKKHNVKTAFVCLQENSIGNLQMSSCGWCVITFPNNMDLCNILYINNVSIFFLRKKKKIKHAPFLSLLSENSLPI